MSSKKKPTKKNPPGLREACDLIVADIYTEIDRVEAQRLAAHLTELETVRASITELSIRIAVLERRSNGPISRFLRRLLRRG